MTTRNFDGVIDEVEIFDRALRGEEIRAIYNAGSAGKIKPPPPPPPEPIPPPAGMVSWWPGDGNANDIVDGNDGTLSGDATFTPGMVEEAFNLDGTGDFVVVPDSPNLNITSDVTVDLWAKRTVFDGSSPVMIAKGAGAIGVVDAPDLYFLSFDSTDHLNGDFERADGSNVILIGPTVTDTNFHHYAYVRSGDTHKLFMDGVMVTGDTFTGSPGDTSGIELAIGALRHDAFPGGFCCHFGGVIDEVELFNRALTADEIRSIYEAGSAGKIKPEPEPIPPPAGMVGWWPGDGNAKDIVDGNPGTLQGGVTFAPGLVDQAFSFDGASGTNVSIPDSDSLRFPGSLTFDAWINTTGVGTEAGGSFYADVLRKRHSDDGGLMDVGIGMVDNVVRFFLIDDAGTGTQILGTTIINVGRWHHIAGVRDTSSGEIRLFVDGLLEVSLTDTTGTFLEVNAVPWNIGNMPGGGVERRPWDGLIDEVEIFNRALLADEIRAIYDAGGAGKIKPEPIPPPAGMVSWWPGDGNANDIIDGNPGTLQGGAAFAWGKRLVLMERMTLLKCRTTPTLESPML